MTKDEIQKFINEDINPGLEAHGGYLLMREFDEESKALKVEMGGGCQGCASAKLTLNLMIENMLKEEFPSIVTVEDITEHSKGESPYYSPDER